jgi:integrase-like protein
MLAEWAYGAIYSSSAERTRALDGWVFGYNHHRSHSALGRKPPTARLTELQHNNPLGSYTSRTLPPPRISVDQARTASEASSSRVHGSTPRGRKALASELA